MGLYMPPESVFSQLEHLAFMELAELNKVRLRTLNLTYLNSNSYI